MGGFSSKLIMPESTETFEPAEHGWVTTFVIFAMILHSMGVGMNNAASAVGACFGSGAMSLRKAIVLCASLQLLGAILMGGNAAERIVSLVEDKHCITGHPLISVFGLGSASAATGLWLIASSVLGVPVSAAHSMIAAVVGYFLSSGAGSCMGNPSGGPIWWLLLTMVGAIAAPLGASGLACLLFVAFRATFLRAATEEGASAARAVRAYPFLMFLTTALTTAAIVLLVLRDRQIDEAHGAAWLPGMVAVSICTALIAAVIAATQRKKLLHSALASARAESRPLGTITWVSTSDPEKPPTGFLTYLRKSLSTRVQDIVEENPVVAKIHEDAERFPAGSEQVFRQLLVCITSIGCVAQGAILVPYAISALAIMQEVSGDRQSGSTAWVNVIGGLGIATGALVYGYRLIFQLGVKFVNITPARGFVMQSATFASTTLAGIAGVPVSITHCHVASLVSVALVEGGSAAVNMKILRHVAIGVVCSWLVPGLLSAVIFTAGLSLI